MPAVNQISNKSIGNAALREARYFESRH